MTKRRSKKIKLTTPVGYRAGKLLHISDPELIRWLEDHIPTNFHPSDQIVKGIIGPNPYQLPRNLDKGAICSVK